MGGNCGGLWRKDAAMRGPGGYARCDGCGNRSCEQPIDLHGCSPNGLTKVRTEENVQKILSYDSDLAHGRQIIQIALGHRNRSGRQHRLPGER